MEDWTEFYGDEELPEADDEYERFTEERDAWLLEEAEEAAAAAEVEQQRWEGTTAVARLGEGEGEGEGEE